MKLTLAADLSGPHPEAFGVGYKYLLVVVALDKEGRQLPFARGLQTKTGEETAEALESIIKELRCLDPFVEMVRFHTDAGKEFLNKWVSSVLDKYKIMGTHTGDTIPKQMVWLRDLLGTPKKGPLRIWPMPR